ncbi:TAXI family TRAP transporter solute-binding subunit [Martelella lutilitoris]|uniref:TAXI family TRAP transporter solute-binding subunit n=1 Tax=Martelella lutilitoris TaxID=2583532 RepID=A0A7T7HIK3_9HYPH|nr:TAXI family TRAP transporter solute-binding subunit [Martelella lutilitoris]QQM29802.1 TAXI family TRAP transporter solute-binding subunit [Martelella lutilitoris]
MRKLASLALGVICLFAGGAMAQDDTVTLPKTLVWTSFDTGSLGYNQSIAVGKALEDAYGISLRVLPASTDLSRIAPAREGRVPFALAGSDAFYAFEGVLSYATPDLGPQKLTAVILAGADNGVAMGVAANQDINSIADLKGKKIGWVVSSPSLQSNVRAFLAFGGLTVDDVELVEQPSYGGAWQAFTNGQIDAMTAVTSGSGVLEQAAASPQGLKWLPMPFSDTEGWNRLQAVNPHFGQRKATVGVDIDAEHPLECAGVPYPALITYTASPDLVYNVTKAIDLQAPVYSKMQSGTSGWAADSEVFDWVVPFNEAAVRYYREAGVWTDEDQKHNDNLVARAKVLQEAWSKMNGESGDDFSEKWMKVRADTLEAAGFPAYFR